MTEASGSLSKQSLLTESTVSICTDLVTAQPQLVLISFIYSALSFHTVYTLLNNRDFQRMCAYLLCASAVQYYKFIQIYILSKQLVDIQQVPL
jgi:hypothetical protein